MSSTNSIDFTRGGVGLWLLFVIGAILMVAWARPGRKLFSEGWRKAVRFILLRALFGALMAAPLVGLLVAWKRFGPQYFINMRLANHNLVLGYHWPRHNLVIPLRNVQAIKAGKFRGLWGSTHRVQVDTTTYSYWSFGYGRLEDEEYKALDRMREAVNAQQQRHDLPEAIPPQ